MAKRTKQTQTRHDKKVKQLAHKMQKQGWDTKADIRGFEKPPLIGDKRPDLYVKKQRSTRIYEVETPESIDKDRKQHSTFRRHAGQKRRTKFFLIKTK